MGLKMHNVRVEPRIELINHLAGQFANLLQEKNANVAEMGMSAIILLQIMLQFGRDCQIEVPAHMEVDTPEGYRFSYRIEKIDKKQVPITPSGLIKGAP